MVLTFEADVVGGVEVEEEELLGEGGGGGEEGEGVGGGVGFEGGGEGGEEEEGEGDRGVFEVVEVVGGDGEVGVKRLVAGGTDEEFHGDGDGGGEGEEEEFEAAGMGEGEPRAGAVGVGVEGEEFDVVEEMPEADEEETEARGDMADQSTHSDFD